MDETLFGKSKANIVAKHELAKQAPTVCGDPLNGEEFAELYLQGFYRQWTPVYQQRYLKINEDAFGVQLIQDTLANMQPQAVTVADAQLLKHCFIKVRQAAFGFSQILCLSLWI
jgi:hypothetical protein